MRSGIEGIASIDAISAPKRDSTSTSVIERGGGL